MGGLDQSVGISTTSDVPPSIPLPNQTSLNPNVLNTDSQNGMNMADVSTQEFQEDNTAPNCNLTLIKGKGVIITLEFDLNLAVISRI